MSAQLPLVAPVTGVASAEKGSTESSTPSTSGPTNPSTDSSIQSTAATTKPAITQPPVNTNSDVTVSKPLVPTNNLISTSQTPHVAGNTSIPVKEPSTKEDSAVASSKPPTKEDASDSKAISHKPQDAGTSSDVKQKSLGATENSSVSKAPSATINTTTKASGVTASASLSELKTTSASSDSSSSDNLKNIKPPATSDTLKKQAVSSSDAVTNLKPAADAYSSTGTSKVHSKEVNFTPPGSTSKTTPISENVSESVARLAPKEKPLPDEKLASAPPKRPREPDSVNVTPKPDMGSKTELKERCEASAIAPNIASNQLSAPSNPTVHAKNTEEKLGKSDIIKPVQTGDIKPTSNVKSVDTKGDKQIVAPKTSSPKPSAMPQNTKQEVSITAPTNPSIKPSALMDTPLVPASKGTQPVSSMPTTTKSPSISNEALLSITAKPLQFSGSAASNGKQPSQIDKSKPQGLPTTTTQSSSKQSAPVTSSPAPPVTQALQASVPSSGTKPLESKSNGASQSNLKESAAVAPAEISSQHSSKLSSDVPRKSVSPLPPRSAVGPPKPTTANVAPVIPPKQSRNVPSGSTTSESTYNQKASQPVQSSHANPATAEAPGAYQWPMHAMAAAASSAGSGSAYDSGAASYGSGNMTGSYGSSGAYGGGSAASTHAQNPFMNPLMTQMRQTNPQAAAMLAFAAAASAAQQAQLAQRQQQQQQQQLQQHQQQLHQQHQHYQQQHHQAPAHHQQHHQQHSHHQPHQHHTQQHPHQQPPPAHHSHQQQRHQPWPSSAYGSSAHSAPSSSHDKSNKPVAHAPSHHPLSGVTKPPASNQIPKHVPTTNVAPPKAAHAASSANTMPSKHTQSTTNIMPPKAIATEYSANLPSKQPMPISKEISQSHGHMAHTLSSKISPLAKPAHTGSYADLPSSKSSSAMVGNVKSDKVFDAGGLAPRKVAAPSPPNTTSKSLHSTTKPAVSAPPASQPMKAVPPPKQTDQGPTPFIKSQFPKQDESLQRKIDTNPVEQKSSLERESQAAPNQTRPRTAGERKMQVKPNVEEKPVKDKESQAQLESKITAKDAHSRSSKHSSDYQKTVPPLKLHKMLAATSPPLHEEKVPPLKISTSPPSVRGGPAQRTVAPLKLGKLPQLKSPKPAEKKPRKRPLAKPQAPIIPARESKRARKQATQFESPDPELQQIMKTIKLQELADKQKQGGKQTKIAELAAITKQEIDEEMPLKVKGKPGRKSKKSISEEDKPCTLLDTDSPSLEKKSPEKIATTAKKDAVFFKGECLALRNADGGFYLCQALQNIYRTSKKIRIVWLTEIPKGNPDKDIFAPEYSDRTEFETILTSVDMTRHGKKMYKLPKSEDERIRNILKRAVDKESGKLSEKDVSLTEDNPDGLDISIYKDEDQLKELDRRKKSEEKKKPGKGKQKVKGDAEKFTKPPPSSNISKGIGNEESPLKIETKDVNVKGKEIKLPEPKGKRGRPPKSNPVSSKAPPASAAKAQPAPKSTSAADLKEPSAIPEVRRGRKPPARRISETPASKSTATADTKKDSVEMKGKKETEKQVVKDKPSGTVDKLPAKLANKRDNKQKNSKGAPNKVEPKEETKSTSSTKIAQRPQKRKLEKEKEVFEFEDDFEEEVMPIPKKRAALKDYVEKEKPNESISKPSNVACEEKVKTVDDKLAKTKTEKGTSSESLTSTKVSSAPKLSNKRGRGRSRK